MNRVNPNLSTVDPCSLTLGAKVVKPAPEGPVVLRREVKPHLFVEPDGRMTYAPPLPCESVPAADLVADEIDYLRRPGLEQRADELPPGIYRVEWMGSGDPRTYTYFNRWNGRDWLFGTGDTGSAARSIYPVSDGWTLVRVLERVE